MSFDKITSRINKLCYGLDPTLVDAAYITQKVIQGIRTPDLIIHCMHHHVFTLLSIGVYPGVTTIELDELAAQTAASCATKHPDFSILAARISVSNLHKQTSKIFSEVVEKLFNNVHPKTNQKAPLVSEQLLEIVSKVTSFLFEITNIMLIFFLKCSTRTA